MQKSYSKKINTLRPCCSLSIMTSYFTAADTQLINILVYTVRLSLIDLHHQNHWLNQKQSWWMPKWALTKSSSPASGTWEHSGFLFNSQGVLNDFLSHVNAASDKTLRERKLFTCHFCFPGSKNTRRWRGPPSGWRCWRAGTSTRTVRRWFSICQHIPSSSFTLIFSSSSHDMVLWFHKTNTTFSSNISVQV